MKNPTIQSDAGSKVIGIRLSALAIACVALAANFAIAAEETGFRAAELRGQFVQGGSVFGRTDPENRVEFGGRTLRLSANGDFVFGFTREAPAEATLTITGPDGRRHEQKLEVAPRDFDIQRIDGLPPSKVTPPKAALDKIRADAAATREARKVDSDRIDFLAEFIWPAEGPITGVYGSQRVLNGEPRNPHFGVDVAGPVGTPIVAPAGGVVTLAVPDMYFSGGTLILDHGHGYSSTFLHLSELLVEVGQEVRQGELIARMGATGRATGSHLDWRINWFGARLDPELLVPSRR